MQLIREQNSWVYSNGEDCARSREPIDMCSGRLKGGGASLNFGAMEKKKLSGKGVKGQRRQAKKKTPVKGWGKGWRETPQQSRGKGTGGENSGSGTEKP